MSHHDHSHHDLIADFALQLQPLLEESQQGIYVYFDDEHKFCNERFATLLGYASAEEWSQMQGSFPPLFVEEKSHDALIGAYQTAMQDLTAATIKVSWKKKGGGSTDTTVTLVPISYQNHLFALHFVA